MPGLVCTRRSIPITKGHISKTKTRTHNQPRLAVKIYIFLQVTTSKYHEVSDSHNLGFLLFKKQPAIVFTYTQKVRKVVNSNLYNYHSKQFSFMQPTCVFDFQQQQKK